MSDIDKKLSPIGKAMAKQMNRSWASPQFSVETEIDCDSIISYRKNLPFKTSYTTILAKVVSELLGDFPSLRSSWAEDHIVEHETINMGIAVDTKRGLLVPVIANAGEKSIEDIHNDMEWIKSGASTGLYTMDQMTGAVFTISNLGVFNVTSFKAIVNAPEAAILAVGKMVEKPIVRNGEITVGRTMKLNLSADHRVTDGATVAKFMTALAEKLENL